MTGFSETPALPPLAECLASGGDARIACDSGQGRNRYGCLPTPEPGILAYGSATASTISPAGFAAAGALWERLERAARTEPPSATYARELDRLRRDLAACCGLEGLPGLEIVFGPSGTDLHLFLSQLVVDEEEEGNGPLPLIVRPEASETGRGVPQALEGRHFSSRTARGRSVEPGESIAEARPVEVREIPCRTVSGETRCGEEACEAAAAAAAQGRRVLLVLADVSKTGLVAPSPASALALRDRFPGRIDIAVDASQFRLSLPTLRAYLEHGFLVAVTGSKFVTGPAFCGALLAAGDAARRLRSRTAPSGLNDYSSRADWPREWEARRVLDDAANYGLLLRWEAALAEMRSFHRLPEAAVASFLREFAAAVAGRLRDDPSFLPLATTPPERGPIGPAGSWDRIPTLFPFLLRRPGAGGAAWLDCAETAAVYAALRSDLRGSAGAPSAPWTALRCEIGQPIECGRRDGTPVSALRLCASARLAVEALEGRGAAAVIGDAMAVLDKASFLALRTSA